MWNEGEPAALPFRRDLSQAQLCKTPGGPTSDPRARLRPRRPGLSLTMSAERPGKAWINAVPKWTTPTLAPMAFLGSLPISVECLYTLNRLIFQRKKNTNILIFQKAPLFFPSNLPTCQASCAQFGTSTVTPFPGTSPWS